MKKNVVSLLVIVMSIFVITGCNGSKIGTAPDGSEVDVEKGTMKFIKEYEAGGYKLLPTEELNKWIGENKDMVIVDTMPADYYGKGHIPGAVNAELPATSLVDATEDQISSFIELLGEDKSKPIVVYCGFVSCARSDVGAVIAMEQGFTEVYRVPGGIAAWQQAGYEIEKNNKN
ncbi:rhodanese-like domain-containing protein [Calidifontibacillus oryziterrae]|uniref:rhodanese-like domain-containing protein n=1 Tax=Calidifontibacillus oryziterrae TaxID=1191699 RepID=UPI000306DEE8|nr:rhodanese-like domain-containing protein [Calidifontibacillus oryziterrae]